MEISSAPATPQPALTTLGKFELRIGDRLAPPMPTHKARALFALLVSRCGRDVSRERLLELFWEDCEPDRAREGLRTALSSIRHALREVYPQPEELLFADKSVVRWVAPTQLDANRFVELAESHNVADKRAALELYGGDFLEGNYEDWVVREREQIATIYESVLESLVQQTKDIRAARLLLARNPFHEEAYAVLIDSELLANRQLNAAEMMAQYRAAMQEMNDTPSAAFEKRFAHVKEVCTIERAARRVEGVRFGQVQATVPQTNLPPQLTSFIGREHVLAEIIPLIEKSPLVTLVGAGGVGKTRCAEQIGRKWLDGWSDGVWLAELASISEPSLVAGIAARALGVQETSNLAILDTLIAYLKRKRLLLIVDNCEHVIDEARHVVAAILHECPEVRILATSREALNISGEQLYRMPSLSVPPADQTLHAQEVLTFGAPLLFNDRALSADNHFTLTDENAPHVAEICRRLDGIPLAIELAAARVKALSPRQLSQKLNERFRVLIGGDRCGLPRHQTMRALIDWSYDLLADEERLLFRELSIFAGGFTLESANAVCGIVDEIIVLNVLSSLVDKSLVQSEPGPGGTRYRLLESTRQYARERLLECGEYASVARAHASAFLALAEYFRSLYETTPDRAWSAQVGPEIENWRAALEWALTCRGDVGLGQRMAGALQRVWLFFAPAEGRRWVQAAIATVDTNTSDQVIAELDLAESLLDRQLHQYKTGYEAAQRALARLEHLDDSRGAAEAKMLAARHLIVLGRVAESEPLLEAALARAERLGLRKLVCSVLDCLALARTEADDLAGAQARYVEALGIARAAGSERTAAIIACNLGEVEFRCGNASAALRLASESLEGHRALDTANFAFELCNIAAYLVALGHFDDARVRAREALRVGRDTQFEVCFSIALAHFAAIATLRPYRDAEQARDDRTRAARLLGYVEALPKSQIEAREYTEQQEYDKVISQLRDALGVDELAKLMIEGSTWSEDQAVAEAMLV